MVYQAAIRGLKISDVLRTVLEKKKSYLSSNFSIVSSVDPLVSTDTVSLSSCSHQVSLSPLPRRGRCCHSLTMYAH